MAPADSYSNSNRPPQNMAVDHNFVMDQPKLVDDEAVGQRLATKVVSNKPLMGPGPSVSTGTAKSVKLSSLMQTDLKAKKRRFHTVEPKKEDSTPWSPPYLPRQTEASRVQLQYSKTKQISGCTGGRTSCKGGGISGHHDERACSIRCV
jgi:hypothetical protein